MKRNYQEELMVAISPFVAHYQKYPIGFAETDNLNDIYECQMIVDEIMNDFNFLKTAQEKKDAIKRELDRWNKGKNAGYIGRYYARLEYLKSKN